MTPLQALANALPGKPGAWVASLDPIEAFGIVAVALLVLGAIPATSRFALWAGLGLFLLLLITGQLGSGPYSATSNTVAGNTATATYTSS